MKLIGVGVGPGDIELFTLKAINAIEEAAYIFIPESRGKSIAYDIARPLLEDKYNIIFLDIPMGCGRDLYKTYAERIFRTSEGKTSVFLTLGDPSIYSTFIYIADEIKNLGGDVSTIPGIPSFIAAAALIGEPLLRKGDKMIVCDSIDEIDLKGLDAVVVLKTLDKEKILNLLEEEGFKYFYIKRCTQKDEMVLTDRDDILKDNDYLSMIIAKRS